MADVRHEVFDPRELEAKNDLDELEAAKFVVLLTREQISGMLQQSQAKLAAIEQTHEAQRVDIAKIDKNLRPDIIQDRTKKIKESGKDTIEGALKLIRDNAVTAKHQERFWGPQAVRLRASFSDKPDQDATIYLAWSRKAEKLDAVMLVELAALASSTNNLALAALIETEMLFRNTDGVDPRTVTKDYRKQIRGFIDSIPNASGEVLQMLAEIQYLAPRAGAAASGHIEPYMKIRQALLEGKVPQSPIQAAFAR